MEKRILKIAVIQSVFFLFFCLSIGILQKANKNGTLEANTTAKYTLNESIDRMLTNCSSYIKVEKSKSILGNIKVQNYVLKKKIKLIYTSFEPISFTNIIINSEGTIKDKQVSYTHSEKQYEAEIEFSLNEGYEAEVYQDAGSIYIGFYEPKDLYKKVIILDAGHGGIDSGTFAVDKEHMEKRINLSVTKKIKEKLDQFEDVKVYMTRESDIHLSPEDRIEMINSVKADYCISIHCNSADNLEASGVEVLYSEKSKDGTIKSKNLANILLKGIIGTTKQVNRGLLKGDNIYIMRKSNIPIALVEIGFISNKNEFSYLIKDENQDTIAEAIVEAIQVIE